MKTCFILAFLLAGLRTPSFADEEPPKAVQDYITGIEKRLLANEDYQESLDGDVLYGEQRLLFKKPAHDFRTGVRSAWLIGYQIGTISGHALSDVTMIVLVDENGKEIFVHPDETRGQEEGFLNGGYKDGVVVRAAKGVYLIGLAGPGSRGSPGYADVWHLGKEPRKLMGFEDADYPTGEAMEQEILFEDIDADGKCELLVEKRNPKEGKILSRTVYRLDVEKLKFVKDLPWREDLLEKFFTQAKAKKETPRIEQHSRIYEVRK